MRTRPSAATSRPSRSRRSADRSRSTPASSSTTNARIRRSSGCSRSSASRRRRATCRWARPVGRATSEFSSRGVRGYLATPASIVRPGHWRMMADILRFYREARAALDRSEPSTATLGEFLDDGGYGPRVPTSFPRPHHVRGLVDGRRADPRLPDRLPAALPRQPRPDRLRQCAPVADDPGWLDALRRSHRGRTARRLDPRRSTPVIDVARDAAGVTIRTADGADRAVRCRGHGHPCGPGARPAPRCRSRRAGRRSAGSSTRRTGRPPHRCGPAPPPRAGTGIVERRTRTIAPGRARRCR